MEEIRKIGKVIFYGNEACRDADDAYRKFRDDYHESLGKVAWRRLNRIGSRTDRMRGSATVFSPDYQIMAFNVPTVKCRLMGMMGPAYCWMMDVPDICDDAFWDWLDAASAKGSQLVRMTKRRRSGRTSSIRRDMRRQYTY